MRSHVRVAAILLVTALVASGSIFTTASAATRTLTFGPQADATIRADKPTRSYGTASTVTIDNSPVIHTLMRFVVSGVGTDTVNGATLRLYVTNGSPTAGTVFRVANQTWSESVTWNTAPVADATSLTTGGTATANAWTQFNLSSLITGDGTYSVRITSTSADGATFVSREGTSTQRPQLVVTTTSAADTTPPSVSVTAPSGGATLSGSVGVTANASDDTGVTAVDVAIDGSTIGTDTTSPYQVAWDTTKAANGSHTITAIAHDAAGHTTTSSPVAVTVANDVTSPTVSVTAPSSGATVSGSVDVTANASDDTGVTAVDVAIDGNVIGTDSTGPYQVTWDTTTTANGSHVVTAIAHDAAGHRTTSDPVTVDVSNAIDTAPSTPGNLAAVANGPTSVTLTWDASQDDVGVSGYEVSRGTTVLTTVSSPGYTDDAAPSGATVTYSVVALDGAGHRSDPATTSVDTPSPPPPPPPTSFTFAAAGDHGASTRTTASLAALDASPASFYLALGDMDYDETPTDAAWCDYVHQNLPTKGGSFPFELVTGNHEDDFGPNGSILNFAACLPDHMGAIAGPGSQYGVEYAFDYPASAPLARFIMLSPELTVAGKTYHYTPGTPEYQWVSDTIDAAHAAGIPWVIVGFHFPCLTAGNYQCGSGPALMNLLVSKHVDLVLHGHEHSYQRSKQLALDPTTCASIASTGYNPACVVDDGIDGVYPKGAGTVDVIAGTFGRGLYNVNRTDPEAPYFAKMDGTSNGFMQYTLTADRLDATFVRTGGAFNDAFSIVKGATPYADRTAPTAPAGLAADTSTPGRVNLSWTASTDPDDAVASYTVLRDGVSIGSTSGTTFSDPSVSSGLTYSYEVIASDTAFNTSVATPGLGVTVPQSTTLTFVPEADATIRADLPTSTYGTLTTIATDGSPIKDFLIRFTVTGVGTQTVTAATLRLTCTDPSPYGGTFSMSSNAWTESTVTWNTAPPAGSVVTTLGKVVAGSVYDVDLSSLIHGDGTYTLRVSSANADGADYTSREGLLASRPQLVLTVG